jgi:hypothetical protein
MSQGKGSLAEEHDIAIMRVSLINTNPTASAKDSNEKATAMSLFCFRGGTRNCPNNLCHAPENP